MTNPINKSEIERAVELAKQYEERFGDNNYEDIMDRDVSVITKACLSLVSYQRNR